MSYDDDMKKKLRCIICRKAPHTSKGGPRLCDRCRKMVLEHPEFGKMYPSLAGQIRRYHLGEVRQKRAKTVHPLRQPAVKAKEDNKPVAKCFECGDPVREAGSNYCAPCFDILLATLDGGIFPENPVLDWMRYNGFTGVQAK